MPRVALTKQLGRFHAKALFSSAFRAPSVENLTANSALRPERTRVFELEAGYQLSDALSVSANAFDIHIGQPIVYAFDPVAGGDTYRNFERSGTRGAELEGALQGAWGRAQLRYSLYTATGEQKVPMYETDHSGTLLGLPNHRVSLAGLARLPFGFTLAPRCTSSGRAPARLAPTRPAPRCTRASPRSCSRTSSCSARTHSCAASRWGRGCTTRWGQTSRFVQPYDGGHAPAARPRATRCWRA